MDRSDWLCLGGLLFVLFATRIVWILWNPDATLYWEEDYRWVVAREIIAGPHQPIFDYQADNYQGGSLVLIGLITGMFAVFGETLLSLKLAPLAFAGATLAAIYTLGRLWFGRRTALIAAGGYLLGPPLLVHSALIPMGSHGESARSLVLLHVGTQSCGLRSDLVDPRRNPEAPPAAGRDRGSVARSGPVDCLQLAKRFHGTLATARNIRRRGILRHL